MKLLEQNWKNTGRGVGVGLRLRTGRNLRSFLRIGGDSIKSIQVSSRLYQAGYKFEIKHLFKYPTISELVPYVEPVTRIAEQGEIKGRALLTPIQHWFSTRNTRNYTITIKRLCFIGKRDWMNPSFGKS